MEADLIPQAPKRTLFLSIVCVLTFIGSGFMLSNQFAAYSTAEERVAKPELIIEAFDFFEDQDMPEEMNNLIDDILESSLENLVLSREKRFSLGMILSATFTLMGAMGMWRLRKWGYHMYLAGTALYIAMPWVAYIGLKAQMQGYVNLFVGLFFVLLYTLSYKRLY
jgi:hypothetical protein